MYKVLHLSHTDISADSRILKEMDAIASAKELYDVRGIGIESADIERRNACQNINIVSITLFSRNLFFVPKVVRHFFFFVETTIKFVVRGIRINPDIIHCADNTVLPIGIIIKLLTRSKLIYDAHELESDRNGLSSFSKRLILFEERLCWGFIDFLIVVGPSIEKWYQANFEKKPSAIILNSPVFKFDSTKSDNINYFRSVFSIPEKEKIFLYVGVLSRGRGIELIIEAFANNSHTSHVIFMGYGEKYEHLKGLSNQFSNIHVHPAVPHDQVVELARTADVGLCLIENVSLSDYFSLPNKLFEYIFSGIPVLASKFPDIVLLVDKYKVGRCCDLKVDSVVEEILRFQSPKSTEFDIKNLYELSWDVQKKNLRKVYRDLLPELAPENRTANRG